MFKVLSHLFNFLIALVWSREEHVLTYWKKTNTSRIMSY